MLSTRQQALNEEFKNKGEIFEREEFSRLQLRSSRPIFTPKWSARSCFADKYLPIHQLEDIMFFTHLLSPLMVSYQLLWPRLTFYERKQVTDLAFREAQHGQILRRQTRRGHCEKNVKELRIMIAGLLENSIEEWETSLENNKVLGMKRENIMITRSIRQN